MAGIKHKLLHKTLGSYTLFAVVLLLLSTPFFYFAMEKLYLDDIDEALILREKEFKTYILPGFKATDIPVWNRYSRDVKILSTDTTVKKGRLFQQFYFDTLANENEPYRVFLSPLTIDSARFTFMARNNLIESDDFIVNIVQLYVIFLFCLFIGLLAITRIYTQRMWRPFYNTLQQIEQFEVDKDKSPHLYETSTEEFDRLNQALQKLIDRNLLIYKSQQEFIENAAHELQTPLAILRAKLDILLQHSDGSDVQTPVINQLYDTIARLSRLNKNLLLLSKIDNQAYQTEEKIEVTDLISNQVDFFSEQAEANNISVQTKCVSSYKVGANRTLTEILVSNLLFNAVRHNTINGTVWVNLQMDLLTVSNTGEPQALSSQMLFKRFSKSNPSDKGSGLGLAIVKKIADRYDWTVHYSFKDNLHVFEVHF